MTAFLARDPLMRIAAAVLAAQVLAFALPLGPDAGRIDPWSGGAALVVALVALLSGRDRLPGRERSFWGWIAFGIASWLGVVAWRALGSRGDTMGAVEQVVVDLAYLLFYGGYVVAAELRPELGERRQDRSVTRDERLGLGAFGVALLMYFAVVPSLLDPLRGRQGLTVDGYFMYLTLDLYLMLRFATLARGAPGRRWRTLYGTLLAAVCLWFPFDVAELAWTWPGSGFSLPPWTYPFSYLGVYATLAAARLRDHEFGESAAPPATEPVDAHPRRLVVYLLLFFGMHVALSLSGLLSSAEHLAREMVVLALLAVLALLVHRQYRALDSRSVGLERQRDAAREQIEWRNRAEAERERFVAELETRQQEMERFTYAVSHDLRSPLITMRGFLSLIEHDAESGDRERLRDDLRRVRTATGVMGRLLDDLLELSRVGRVREAPEDVPLSALVGEAVELVAGRIGERRARVDVAPDLPVVRGDRRRLLQVFQNLIENAVKFGGDAEAPVIRIGAAPRDGRVAAFVRDEGIGLAPQHLERIFDVFQRLDPDVEGTGMGLTLVQRIVELHGGRAWVESEGRGRGSTFWVTLPPGSAGKSVAVEAASAD